MRGQGRIYIHGNWWYVDLTYKGTRFRQAVTQVGAPEAQKKAMAILSKKRTEMAENKFLDVKKDLNVTFRELAEKYMNGYAKSEKKSWQKGDQCYLVHLNKHFGGMQIESISIEDVLEYQTKRKSEVGNCSVNHEISLMRSIFNYAIHVLRNPNNKREPLFRYQNPAAMKKSGFLKKLNEETRDRYMKRGELMKFLEAADSELADYALLAICTGLRKGELKGLSDKKVCLSENMIKLQASDTKSAKLRYVPLCNIAKKIIEKRNFDFKKDIMRTRQTYPFGKALKKAGIENFHWHDFRRTFSTYMEECGVSAERRRRIMGHSDHKMTETYTIVEFKELLNEVRKLDTYLMEIVPSGNTPHNEQQKQNISVDTTILK